MASTTSTVHSLSSTIVDGGGRAPRLLIAASSQCVTIPTLPPPPSVQFQSRAWKTTAHCKSLLCFLHSDSINTCQKIVRDVTATATGEAPAEVAAAEMPEIVKTIQETWDKVEDKYAVTSLAVAGLIALCVFTGMISAIDRLPLVPGVLELVGIGYTGWFVYQNLIFKPESFCPDFVLLDVYCVDVASLGGMVLPSCFFCEDGSSAGRVIFPCGLQIVALLWVPVSSPWMASLGLAASSQMDSARF
ncbi:photosystem I P subunit [Actinidia rufa]|uniref:Photosystem I P subunit n=1 Tax=Actinidia rufa TaxID=165716 RepID=A0A7J0EX39_9ERIC|nr:photosystem I P subunit [Actinidia rufa]